MNQLVTIYKEMIYKLLMTSNGRTTDLLEVLAGEGIELKVIGQEVEQVELFDGNRTTCIVRESYMMNKRSKFILSHNFTKIYTDFTPNGLVSKIGKKEQGMGSVMKNMDITSTRRILDFGWRNQTAIVDLRSNVKQLLFEFNDNVPFKEYEVSFEQNGHPGLHIIEYFNPDLLDTVEFSSEESMELYVK